MLQNDYNESMRRLKDRELTLREKAQAFAREKYEFNVTEKALKALPELQELAQARKDPLTKRYESNTRRNRLRRTFFGKGHEVEPENAQEEAEMLAAKQEREERQRQMAAPPQTETLKGPPVPSSQYYNDYMEVKAEQTAEAQAVEAEAAEAAEEAKRAEAEQKALDEKWHKYCLLRKRFEEIKMRYGWEELTRPPDWPILDGWKDAPLEWDQEWNEEYRRIMAKE